MDGAEHSVEAVMGEASDSGPLLRLNVVVTTAAAAAAALAGPVVVSKILVLVAKETKIAEVVEKIAQQLRTDEAGAAAATDLVVDHLLNSHRARLASGDRAGDVLRDDDEVIAVLRGEQALAAEVTPPRRPRPAPLQPPSVSSQATMRPPDSGRGSSFRGSPIRSIRHNGNAAGGAREAVRFANASSSFDSSTIHSSSMMARAATDQQRHMVAELGAAGPPVAWAAPAAAGAEPQLPVHWATGSNVWQAESLTPGLCDWVRHCCKEMIRTEATYVPSIQRFVRSRYHEDLGFFITVLMPAPLMENVSLPAELVAGPLPMVPVLITMPDLWRFKLKGEEHLQRARWRIERLDVAKQQLATLRSKGKLDSDVVGSLLPLSYAAMDEIENGVYEADLSLFEHFSCRRPVILVDTAGGIGRHLLYVRAALKQVLRKHMAGMEAFQLVTFSPENGEPQAWKPCMQPCEDVHLQEAEVWIDDLVPCWTCPTPYFVAGLAEAVKLVAAGDSCKDADAIYLVSSRDVDPAHHSEVLDALHAINDVAQLPIHVAAVAASQWSEDMLRKIAESSSGGRFVSKRRDGLKRSGLARGATWRVDLVNGKSKQVRHFQRQHLSISSQMRIAEVMQVEEERKEAAWYEELECLERLVMSSEHQFRSSEDVFSAVHSLRTGGGYLYKSERLAGEEAEDLLAGTTVAVAPQLEPDAGPAITTHAMVSAEQHQSSQVLHQSRSRSALAGFLSEEEALFVTEQQQQLYSRWSPDARGFVAMRLHRSREGDSRRINGARSYVAVQGQRGVESLRRHGATSTVTSVAVARPKSAGATVREQRHAEREVQVQASSQASRETAMAGQQWVRAQRSSWHESRRDWSEEEGATSEHEQRSSRAAIAVRGQRGLQMLRTSRARSSSRRSLRSEVSRGSGRSYTSVSVLMRSPYAQASTTSTRRHGRMR